MTTDEPLARLGRAIRTYRELSRMTQDDIGRRGGPSDVTIRGLENGAGKVPNAATLRKLDRGMGWPEGTARKIMDGNADVLEQYDEEAGTYPWLLDFTEIPAERPEWTPEEAEAEYRQFAAAQPMDEQSTPDLLTELAARYSAQANRIRALEREIAALRATRAEMPREPVNTAKLPLPTDAYRLAASRGENDLESFHREMGAAGEESQDPEDWT